MKCLNCGKEIPSWIYDVLHKQYCSQKCEDEQSGNNPFGDLFNNLINNGKTK